MSQIGPKKKTAPKKGRNKPFIPRRDYQKAPGFTLIELLIVSVIILALVSISTPLFRKTFTDLELRETASGICKFIAFAQQEAVVKEGVYKISFDFENKKYRLLKGAAEGEKVKFEDPGGRFGRVFNLPVSITAEGEKNEIIFYPDGHSDRVELRLISRNGKTLRIGTTGILGNAIISEEQ